MFLENESFLILLLLVLNNFGLHLTMGAETADCQIPEANETTQICPQFNCTNEYGDFSFNEIPATTEGVLIKIPCTYGFRDDGLVPIYDSSSSIISKSQKITEADSGAVRICKLEKHEDEKLPFVVQSVEIIQCRNYGTLLSEREVKNVLALPEINPNSFKQIFQKFYPLAFNAQHDYMAAKTLIDGFAMLLNIPELFEEDPGIANQIFSLIESFTRSMYILPGYKITLSNPLFTVETAEFVKNSSNIHDYYSNVDNVKLSFPSEVIKMGLDQDKPKLRVMAYSEDLFFHWGEKPEKGIFPTTTTASPFLSSTTTDSSELENNTSFLSNWRVLSIDVIDADINNLSTEFEYTFYPENKEEIEKYAWNCVFWDEKEKIWSSEGVTSLVINDSVVCKSNHFTAFSVLIDPLPLPFPGSDYAPIQNTVHSNILSILSSIGSAISIVGLAGVLLTYGLFRSLRKERSNRILLNLSVALLLMHLFSISSGKDLWSGYCLIPAALLQYFLHSSLFWMLMEAHHMHQLLISVFVKPETHFILKRCLVAWGIPLVIVTICVAVKPEVYNSGRYDLCIIAAHLNLPLYYIAYMTPVIIILIINLAVFVRIFKVLYKQTVKQKNQSGQGNNVKWNDLNRKAIDNIKKKKYVMLSPVQIKGALTVLLLLGVGWGLGLLAIGPFEVFFKYLFCITNAGQGALIFFFRVILHPQACREWKKALFGFNLDSNEISTTSSTNIQHSTANRKPNISIESPVISSSNSVENSLTPSNPEAKDLANMLKQCQQNGNVYVYPQF